jgi:hypothetical protein
LPGPGTDFSCVKVRANPDLVLAALRGIAYGVPRDLLPVIRGAPCPADGRELGRRAVLYRLERDAWTTILREGDTYASFDALLAQRLSRSLRTRALAFHVGGVTSDLAYDTFEQGEKLSAFLQLEGHAPEYEGVDAGVAALDAATHTRVLLLSEDATNDRVAFHHFELSGMLRGRWDLSFERAILIPELVALDESSQERRVRVEKTVPRATLPSAEPHGVQGVLATIIAETTRGF